MWAIVAARKFPFLRFGGMESGCDHAAAGDSNKKAAAPLAAAMKDARDKRAGRVSLTHMPGSSSAVYFLPAVLLLSSVLIGLYTVST
jgi:hypothetical protein